MDKIFNKKIFFIFLIIIIFATGADVNAQDEGILTETQMLQRAVNEIQKPQEESFIPVRSDEEIKRIMESSPEELKKQAEDNQEKLKTIRNDTLNSSRRKESATNPGFVPLQEIPKVIDKSTADNPSLFFNAMFNFGIIIAGFLAVIMIAIGGIQYMSTDAIHGKSEGREKITYALMGLLLILFSYILLKTINPDILKFDLFN